MRRTLETSPEVATRNARKEFAEARKDLALASRFATEFRATSAHSFVPGIYNPNDTPVDRLYLDPDVRNRWDGIRPFNRVDVELLQPLYTWGELSGSIRAARYGVDVEEASVRTTALAVAYRTGEAYYGVLLAEALNQLTTEAGNLVERAKTEIRRLQDEGAEGVDDADLSQVLITEQEYRRRVVEVRQRRQTAYAGLSRQLFLPEGQVASPDTAILRPLDFALDSLEVYWAQAAANRPEIAQAGAGLAAREALVDVAQSNYYPKVFLGASAKLGGAPGRYRQPSPYVEDPSYTRDLQAGLGVRQQLNFAQTRARVEQAEAERNEVAFQLDAARQLVLFEVEEAYRNVIVQMAALETQTEALRLGNEWMLTEQINFDLDLGDTENLVRAVQSNLELQIGRYEAIHRYNMAVLRLLRVTGTLVQDAVNGTLVEKTEAVTEP